MAIPTRVLPGFSAVMYMQTGASPTPLTTSNLSAYASVSPLAIATAIVPLEAIPAFGQDDAVASFSVAGSRQSDKIPVQSAPTSMTCVAAWLPSDSDQRTNLLQLRSDAYSGIVYRTFVISATDGTNILYFAFNGRVSQFTVDPAPGAEMQATFTIHPRGNQYGWSNNT
jgi:hypothetical protein